jgi:anaerobic ribonucleoside-triphosphate reductase activating protein
VLFNTEANGPGMRTCIWMQGCSINCVGCWNPKALAFNASCAKQYDPVDFAKFIAETSASKIIGLSLSGGEPFDQAQELCTFLAEIKVLRSNWNIFAWTGYTIDAIKKSNEHKVLLLSLIDLVIAGPYVSSKRTLELRWRGSSNQTLHAQTPEGDKMRNQISDSIEFHINVDGTYSATGFPIEVI